MVILPRAQALCSATCVLVQRSSSISMTAAGRTAATLSGGPAAMLVMAQAASKAVFGSTALYCLHHVMVTSEQHSFVHKLWARVSCEKKRRLVLKMFVLYLMTKDFARQLPAPA